MNVYAYAFGSILVALIILAVVLAIGDYMSRRDR